MRKAIITVGMGFGDEGKGATVDYLCREQKVDLVVRYSGGHQCGHNVQLPDGRRHPFSQFGAGTLAGVPTYLGRHVIIDPIAMKAEFKHLVDVCGVARDASLLHTHPKCLVATRYHIAMNRLMATLKQTGTCGQGIGQTRSYWLRHGRDAIFAEDLLDTHGRDLHDKIVLLHQRCVLMASEAADLMHSSRPVYECYDNFFGSLPRTVEVTRELLWAYQTGPLKIGAAALSTRPNDVVVFEGAQGVLLDEHFGFYPDCTWSTVTPAGAFELISDADVEVLGITRSYLTRHGAGPFVDTNLMNYEDIGNPENTWQGKMRFGYLEMPLLRYVKNVVPELTGIVVNHMDEYPGGLCLHQYSSTWTDEKRFRPRFDDYLGINPAPKSVPDPLKFIEAATDTPVVITANGPTHEHRQRRTK